MARSPLRESPARDSPISTEWTRESWQQHVQSERQRIRDEAPLRGVGSPKPLWPTVEEQARRASEEVLSDSTLEQGDIIVTTKGFFIFKGQKFEQRLPDDFEAVSPSRLARPSHPDK
jgi:hypothetical protein